MAVDAKEPLISWYDPLFLLSLPLVCVVLIVKWLLRRVAEATEGGDDE
jgi:hypothetical protein